MVSATWLGVLEWMGLKPLVLGSPSPGGSGTTTAAVTTPASFTRGSSRFAPDFNLLWDWLKITRGWRAVNGANWEDFEGSGMDGERLKFSSREEVRAREEGWKRGTPCRAPVKS